MAVIFYHKNQSHVLYNIYDMAKLSEIYIAIISVTNGHHMPISDCNFSVQQ